LLKKADLRMSVSLPEGAFIPFGGSVSKTCILGLRKKSKDERYQSPQYIFLGKALALGYELGKKRYKQIDSNDLSEFEYFMGEIFEGLKITTNGAECGWIMQSELNSYRLDASYLLNKIDKNAMKDLYGRIVRLKDVCTIQTETFTVKDNETYYYLEVPDISPVTGTITNIRRVRGRDINSSLNKFYSGDILFTRINPRIARIIQIISLPLP
jgi:type I restriction enzyme M protein